MRRVIVCAVLCLAAAGFGRASGAHASMSASHVLRWSSPRQVDRGPTTIGAPRRATGGGIPFTGISCPSARFCVAVDLNGNALVTRTPQRPRSWRRFEIDASAPLDAVSCPSTDLCVAVDTMGGVLSSTDPSSGSQAWARVTIRHRPDVAGTPVPVALTAVGCASAHLCVTGDSREIITATDPRGGPAAWRDQTGLGHRFSGDGLVSVSCPSTRFCAGLGDTGIYASSDPTGPRSTLHRIGTSLEAISCASRSLCVAVAGTGDAGGNGGIWRSTDPAAARPRWSVTRIDPDQQFAVACHRRGLCVATDAAGRVTMSAHPAAAQPSWQTVDVDRSGVLSAISCPTARLCVATDTSGNVLTGRR